MEMPNGSSYDPDIRSDQERFGAKGAGAKKGWLQMNGRKGLSTRLIVAVGAALAIAVGLVATASAQEELITIDSASAAVGGEATVNVESRNILAPGLGAWTVDISYDSNVLTAVACIPENGGVCNPAFSDGVVRITGASAGGVEGDAILGALRFSCDAVGSSPLTLSVPLLVDATIGDPQVIVAGTQNGSITCTAGGPPPADDDDVFDCSDFLFQDIGQAIYDVDPSDPHNLDPDNDGVACKDLPTRGGADSLPPVGVGVGGDVSSGEIARWLMAAFAGLGLAAAGGIGLLRWRATRLPVQRRY